MAIIILSDRVHDHCIFIRAATFKCSTWWRCMGTGENLSDPGDILLLFRWENTGSVVKTESLSLRISDLGWSSQNQHGQFHNGWSCTRSLHSYSSHCVQVFDMMKFQGKWWASRWPDRLPLPCVWNWDCFSDEKNNQCGREEKAFTSNLKSRMVLTRSAWPVS